MNKDNIGKIRIGIDGRILSRELTGIGYYTLEMCRALGQIPELSVILYSPVPIEQTIKDQLPHVTFRSKAYHSQIGRQFWAAYILPMMARKDRLKAFWGPAHALPKYLPKSLFKLITIHDLVWKLHGNTMRKGSRYVESIRMPRSLEISDQVITVSKATGDSVIREFGIDRKYISVIPLAPRLLQNSGTSTVNIQTTANKSVDGQLGTGGQSTGTQSPSDQTSIIAELKDKWQNEHQEYFLFIGTKEPRKNLERLLQAYSRLSDDITSKHKMVVAGADGWGQFDVKKAIEKLKLQDHVRVLGYVPDSDLIELYKGARFLAMPSLYEGFGLPIIEAMSFGTPVLTSDNSSMPEVSGNGAHFVDPTSVDDIEEGLKQMLCDDKLVATLRQFTKTNASKYSWEQSARKLYALIAHL